MFQKSKKSKGKHLSVILSLLVPGMCLHATDATGAIIKAAEIQKCVNSDGDGYSCEEKTVLSVSVSSGRTTTLELTDNPVTEAALLEVAKTPPQIIYPLKYYHTVAFYPHEDVIKVGNPVPGIQKCEEGRTADYPTCRWTYQGADKIEYSQGFCCNKDFDQLSLPDEWRGEVLLGERSTVLNSFSTGHCMRNDGLFFDGYEILDNSEFYEINVKYTEPNGELLEFKLTPADPIYASWNDEYEPYSVYMRGELLGDRERYAAAPDLSGYILYVPASPAEHPYVQDWANNMLLVPREMTSRDGGECNKIGVSFETFRKQGKNSCNSTQAGDCLDNTLFNLHKKDSDLLLTNPDRETGYLVRGMKKFSDMDFLPGDEQQLVYTIPEAQNSLVNLTMDPHQIKSLTTESPGRIDEAYVEDFESMSKDGVLHVTIANIGQLKTDYVVSVTDCDMNIDEAIPAQTVTVVSGRFADLTFDIKTTDNLDTTNRCTVRLNSPDDRLYHKLEVIFDTKKYGPDYSWELTEVNEGSGVGGDPNCVDGDQDGVTNCDGDCDDDDPNNYPGNTEACDGFDNDCDGTADEELGTSTCGLGLCEHTIDNCIDGVEQICDPLEGSTTDICDGLDNDCDGSTDEELGTSTCGLGLCEHTIDNCMGGVEQICDPLEGSSIDICDGLDNDCDGSTDEELGATTCGLGLCEHTIDNCMGGVEQICDPLEGSSIDICDGLDNDCDGSSDEDFNDGDTCSVGVGECQVSGLFMCSADGSETECDATAGTPSAELCDGLDNNCDGESDEDFNDGDVCTVGIGECQASGEFVCSADGTGTECGATPGTPSAELCDGLDNDCDGSSDEDFNDGDACTVGIGECQAGGVFMCSADGTVTECDATAGTPSAELCDGLDNDCDGSSDEDFNDGDACTVGIGECQAGGVFMCGADGTGTECDATAGTPSAELCDGLDNDCDGSSDEDFNDGDACTVGIGECLASGVFMCSADGTGTECDATAGTPSAELCDGLDNDCDGDTDEGVYLVGTFEQPINPDGSSIFKAGRTIPVKVAVTDCGGATTTSVSLAISVHKISDIVNGTEEELDVEASGNANTGNLFRVADGRYIYNLSTKGYAKGTYRVAAMPDGSDNRSITFSLK